MGRRPGDSSDRMFLVVVMEFAPESPGRVLEALMAEHLPALRLPHPSHVKLATDQMRPRVFVVDSDVPGEAELAAVREMRAKDRSGSLIVVLLGGGEPASLPPEFRKLVTAYVRKPVDPAKVARAVIELANDRPPPEVVTLLRKS